MYSSFPCHHPKPDMLAVTATATQRIAQLRLLLVALLMLQPLLSSAAFTFSRITPINIAWWAPRRSPNVEYVPLTTTFTNEVNQNTTCTGYFLLYGGDNGVAQNDGQQ